MSGVEIEAECEGKTAPVWCERPRWEDVYNGYPKRDGILPEYDEELPTEEVFELIFGENYDKNMFTNACATRVSIALLGAGITIGKKVKIVTIEKKIEEVDTTKITLNYKNLKEKRVITGASTMHGWLVKEWGEPKGEFKITKPKSLEEILEKFRGKKGIYTMLPPTPKDFGGITGHCTLWTGKNAFGGNHYAKEAYAVHLWELK